MPIAMGHIGTRFACLVVCCMYCAHVTGQPDSSEKSSSSSSQKHPNIIYVSTAIVETDVGFNNEDVISPNIDQLAKEGVVLDKVYSSQGTGTSNGMYLTGKHMTTLGLHGDRIRPDRAYGLPLDAATLADRLKEQGYATHYVGKWHMGNFKREHTPTYRGFDTFYGYYNAALDNNYQLPCPSNFSDVGYDMWDSEGENLRSVRPQDMVGRYRTHLFGTRATRIIDRHDNSQPFFMVLALHKPAPSVGPNTPQAYVDLYNDKSDTLELGVRRRFAQVTMMDDMLGELVEALKFNDMWENTLMVFTSTHGGYSKPTPPTLNLVGVYSSNIKPWLRPHDDEVSQRTLAIFRSPRLLGNRQGVHITDFVHITDMYPTLLCVAGIPHAQDEEDVYGLNMWPTIRYGVQGPRNSLLLKMIILDVPAGGTPLYTDTFDTRWHATYVDDGFKIVTGYFSSYTKTYWLYNIIEDPHEQNDLSDLPAYTSRLRAMLDALQTWFVNTPPPLHFLPESAQDPAACPRHHHGYFAPWK